MSRLQHTNATHGDRSMRSRQELLDTLALVAKGLGNGHRLALLERLTQSEASVEMLASDSGLTVANTSQHLQHLRKAGLVTASRSGKQMLYQLTDTRILDLIDLMTQIARTNIADVERFLSQLIPNDYAGASLEPVTREELLQGISANSLVLLDVRSVDEFNNGHLPNALNIPIDQIELLFEQLPKNKAIVAYCRGPYCTWSHYAVSYLAEKGFHVRRFEEGFPEWKAAGLPIH